MTSTLIRKHGCSKCPISAYCLTTQATLQDETRVAVAACRGCGTAKLLMFARTVFVWMAPELVARIPLNCKVEKDFFLPTCPKCADRENQAWDHRLINVFKPTLCLPTLIDSSIK